MAEKLPASSKRARSRRDDDERQAGRGPSQNGDGDAAATDDLQLAHDLQERIKPGLSPGALQLLARAVTKWAAHRRPGEDSDAYGEAAGREDDDVREEVADDDAGGEADVDFGDEEDVEERSLEDDVRDLQAHLGDDWILRVCVQGDYAWLTAEKDDGSQHVEAPAADLLAEVVALLNESGARSS
jgi:hypothetical protein